MNTEEEKIFQCCNELVVKVEEAFYMYDKEFDSSYCNYILYIIGKLYIEKGISSIFEKQICHYIEKCLSKIDSDYKYDYKILYDNLEYLLIDGFITKDDIKKLRRIINNYLENKTKSEKTKYSEQKSKDKTLILHTV